MNARSGCAEAAVKAFKKKTPFAWGNRDYKISKVEPWGEKDIKVHLMPC
ncbi:hypothetical protein [Vibrio europaeus]|nr:hypothetical protein [Vibrio europaeus]MDC5753544.1 hypothetical protein [Vibrio europaeus]